MGRFKIKGIRILMEMLDLIFFTVLFIFLFIIFGLSLIATMVIMLINDVTSKKDKNEHKQNIRR
jgi:hypothetical protein